MIMIARVAKIRTMVHGFCERVKNTNRMIGGDDVDCSRLSVAASLVWAGKIATWVEDFS
jgi:hypothetical protein